MKIYPLSPSRLDMMTIQTDFTTNQLTLEQSEAELRAKVTELINQGNGLDSTIQDILVSLTGMVTQKVLREVNKLDLTNFTGSWHGIDKPSLTNEGISGSIELLESNKQDKNDDELITPTKNIVESINHNYSSIQIADSVINPNNVKAPFGCNYYCPTNTGWKTEVFDKVCDGLVANGMDCVVILPFVNVQNYTDSDIITYYDNDSKMKECINIAKGKGLKVYMKLHIVPLDKHWQKYVNPTDVDTFFTNLTEIEKHYAHICEEMGIDIYCIGEENANLSNKNRGLWVSMIESIRSVYNGKITYGCNFAYQDDEYSTCCFLDKLDIIGLDNYTPLSFGLETDYSTAKDLAENVVLKRINKLHEQYDKPIMFTEFGYGKWKGGCLIPNGENVWDYSSSKNQRDLEMYNGFKAILDCFNNIEWFVGFWYWSEKQETYETNAMTINNTPKVAQLIKEMKEGK